ncbi:MAG: tetratricopeptide repeat protein [Pyrinomonadaceae bacterium]
MSKNILYCVVGLTLGFFVGFLLANNISFEQRAASAPSGVPASQNAAAPPLDPTTTTGELPPGHPAVEGGGANGSAAASSAQAQAAMEAADRTPKNFDLQMNAAAVFYQLNDFSKAALYLQRALEIKPKDVDALTAMGNTKYDTGDFTGAATYYERALAIDPKNGDVQTDLGNTYFRRTPPDFKRAIAEYRKTISFNPTHEKALQNMAAAALQLGDKATAKEALDKLAAVNANNEFLPTMRTEVEKLP